MTSNGGWYRAMFLLYYLCTQLPGAGHNLWVTLVTALIESFNPVYWDCFKNVVLFLACPHH